MTMQKDCILKKAYAVVNKSGKLLFAKEESALIYKTKIVAEEEIVSDDGEKVVRVSICLTK